MRSQSFAYSLLHLATYFFIVTALISTSSCSRSKSPTESPPPPGPTAPVPGVSPPVPSPRPQQPKPSGKPSPTAICGHAVAYAGWSPQGDGARDRLFFCDPGDNELEGRSTHGWDAQPREVPIRYGTRRPNIVLLPAGAFTITGAILISTTNPSPMPSQDRDEITAAGMPDLSQNKNPDWLGLCGSTSGADILFFMAQQKPNVLPEYLRGPSPEADAHVIQVLTGDQNKILPQSLAGRMGIGPDGFGATNLGIRKGMESWLGEHDSNSWFVELDWLSDEEKPREKQREFFDRLAACVRGGGGAIVCLWPGSEFSDAATGIVESGSDSAESPPPKPGGGKPTPEVFPNPEFPEPKPSTDSELPAALPGRKTTGKTAEEALEQARQQMSEAKSHLKHNRLEKAFERASQAVSVLLEHSHTDKACQTELTQAIELCRKIEEQIPQTTGQSLKKDTLFQ